MLNDYYDIVLANNNILCDDEFYLNNLECKVAKERNE